MLNSSILSMITSGLSWGCLMPRLSLSEKIISGSLFFCHLHRTLFISLPCAFFRDFNVPPTVSPPEIVFISLAGVWYPLSPEFCLGHPFIGTCVVLSFWCTFATSLARLKSPPSLSNVCTHQYNARGPGGIYSTCFCLFFLMEC